MAQVILANNWFGPDGCRYRKHPTGGTIHVDDDLVSQLPTTARVVSMDDGSTPPPFRPRMQEGYFTPGSYEYHKQLDSRPKIEADGETLRDFDELRGKDDAVYGKMTKAVEEKQAIDAAVAEKRRVALEKARAAKEAKRKAQKEATA